MRSAASSPHEAGAGIDRVAIGWRARRVPRHVPADAACILGEENRGEAGVRAGAVREPVAGAQAGQVTVTALEVLEQGERRASLRVVCSSGFYVRSLAHELGRGWGAEPIWRRCAGRGPARSHSRTRCRSTSSSTKVPQQRRGCMPLERLLPAIPSVVLTEDGVRRALHGNTGAARRRTESAAADGRPRVRLLDGAGRLVGIAELEPGGLLHPVIVLV